MSEALHLRCSDPACAATLDARDNPLACPRCGALLDVVVPMPQADPRALRRTWSDRRRSNDPLDASGVWRFREFLPAYPPSAIVSLREGDTALARLVAGAGTGEYFVNSLNPFRLEGQKTVVFELLDQLQWSPPDFIVLPGGNLGNVSAFGKAIEELVASGLIVKRPRLVVVQAEGAN